MGFQRGQDGTAVSTATIAVSVTDKMLVCLSDGAVNQVAINLLPVYTSDDPADLIKTLAIRW